MEQVVIRGWHLRLYAPQNSLERVMFGGKTLKLNVISFIVIGKFSFGVVLWEILTGEKPYSDLNMFVVAYGVGHGTLTLPIPEHCPKSLEKLMNCELTLPLFVVLVYVL